MKKYDSFFAIFFIFFGFILNAQIPIMAFYGVQNPTDSDYKRFKDAGFTISFFTFKNNEEGMKALDFASKNGVKIMYYTDELITATSKTVNRVKNHPGLYGYYIADEPGVEKFSQKSQIVQTVQKLDREHPTYINLFPNYATQSQLGANSYQHYLESYLKTVPTPFFSFDFYPVKGNTVDSKWYSNLEDVRNASLKFNKPFWGFANATIFGQHKQPTLAGLKLQQYSNLLYGAKGLQYFTYWTLDTDNWKKSGFSYSIVYSNGKPTPTYAIVKNLNENIQRLAWVFTYSKVTAVHHDGNSIPVDTSKLQSVPEKFSVFNPSKREVLVSQLQNGNRYFVAVQNKNINSSIIFTYKANAGVQIVDSNTGKIKNIKSSQTTSKILPGDLLIFTYTK